LDVEISGFPATKRFGAGVAKRLVQHQLRSVLEQPTEMETNTMKTALKIAAGISALSALSGLASTAHAQASATASANGSATIIQAIAVTKTSDLAFGTIVKPTTGTSTISMSSTGNAWLATGGNAVRAGSGAATSAAFSVTGEGASAFSISVPPTFNLVSNGNTLVVSTTQSATTATLLGTIGSPGSQTFGVGGSFPLTTSAASGAYTGSFVVTVAYN
jgi:hypothetical protein